MVEDDKNIERSIKAITDQIELLSRKCTLRDNKKGENFQQVLDASTLILQLSRSLNELLVTQRFLENTKNGVSGNIISEFLNGRKY